MLKTIHTLILALLALLSVTAAVFLYHDGSLARLTGWYHFRPGMSLFPDESRKRLKEVSWMRIQDLHDTIECERMDDGSWWIVSPFRDRMSPAAAHIILAFTETTTLVDTLPLNRTTSASLREFGVESSPHTITLKVPVGDGDMTTIARYTLGSASPWLAASDDGESLLPTSYLRTDFFGRDKRIHVVKGNILSIFQNGLEGLRDPHPLSLMPEDLLSFSIASEGEKEITFSRMSAETAWNITSPILCEADQNTVEQLLTQLSHMKAVRVDEQGVIELPPAPQLVVKFNTDAPAPQTLSIYPPFPSPSDGQLLCYATVSDRPVVFTLQVEPKLRRRGPYSQIVNNIFSLPVLPPPVQARIHAAGNTVYVADLPYTLSRLRSQRLTNIGIKDIDRVNLRSRFSPYPLRLLRIPGDEKDGQMEDVWMFSAVGRRYEEADPEVVKQFLDSLSSVPVAGFVEDFALTDNVNIGMRKYGLTQPDYTLILQPRECAARAILFGLDLPLVKDRAPRSFFLKSYNDGKENYWVGIEQNTHSIYRLNPKMTKLFSFSPLVWKKKNLTQFPVSALRKITLYYQKVALELYPDYIGDSWTGTLGGEDVTPRINPHRAAYYVQHLQKIRVSQWLSPDDEDALEALKEIAFSVKLNLEIVDNSTLDDVIVVQKNDDERAPDESSTAMVTRMLSETDEIDEQFRQMALGKKKVLKKTITIDITPMPDGSTTPSFYGRIRENGNLFILSYEDAIGLDGQLLD